MTHVLRLMAFGEAVAEHLNELAEFFDPGSVNFTFVATFPGEPDKTIFISSDKHETVIEGIKHILEHGMRIAEIGGETGKAH